MELLLRFRLHLFQPAGPIEKAVLFDLDAFWRKKTVSKTGGIVACNRARGQRPDVVVIDVDRGKRSPLHRQRDDLDVRDANSCMELRRSAARAPRLQKGFAAQEDAPADGHD